MIDQLNTRFSCKPISSYYNPQCILFGRFLPHFFNWAYRYVGTSTNSSAIWQISSMSMLAALAQYSISAAAHYSHQKLIKKTISSYFRGNSEVQNCWCWDYTNPTVPTIDAAEFSATSEISSRFVVFAFLGSQSFEYTCLVVWSKWCYSNIKGNQFNLTW